MKKFKIEEGQKLKYDSLSIKLNQIQESFYEKDGIHISVTEYTLELTHENEIKIIDGTYGSEFSFLGYHISVKDCAVGTRDWKSFVEIEIHSEK